MTDLNYELVHATAEMADERSALLQLLLRDLGLSHTKPTEATWSNSRGSSSKIDYVLYRTPSQETLDQGVAGLSHTKPTEATWSNSRGSSSKIDYVLYRTPSQETLDQGVATGSDELLGSDHQLITFCVAVNKGPRKRVRQRRTNCGKWVVDYTKAVPLCNKLACDVDVSGAEEDCRRSQDPLQKRQLGRDIVASRAEAKKAWRMELFDRAAAGDYQVISYFRRKQSLKLDSACSGIVVRTG
eukprot:s1538_g15.t1